MIDLRADDENAFNSMLRGSESSSNEINESDLQSEKYDEQRTFTFRGIVIDLRVKQRMHLIQCAPVVNHSRMKLTKLMCNSRNMMNKEIRHFAGL
jgi:hypothetical protein